MANRLSPLRDLINSSILVSVPGIASVLNGRYGVDPNDATKYLVRSYLQRLEGEGTDDGELPSWGSRASSGGGSTSTWLFRGYGIEYAIVSNDFEHGADESGISWLPILSSGNNPRLSVPIYQGSKVSIRHGQTAKIYSSEIVIIGGKYAGQGPDRTIYYELQGIPVTLRGSIII